MALEQSLMQMLATTIKEVAAKVMEKALNDIVKADPEALSTLIEMRVFCKPAVETDTLAIPYKEDDAAPLQLGVLGLLNMLAGLHGLLIEANYTDDTKTLIGFTVKVREEKKDGDGPKQPAGEETPGASPPG